jgi:MoaA/NifB/PqqE/SkfB family radical SAM enzyme
MKHYCPIPFVNLYTELDGLDPCCAWDRLGESNPATDYEQAFNGIKITQVRNDLLQGKEVANCRYCYDNEKVGQFSFRQEALQNWGVVVEPQLKRLDMVFDNICNLKCRGCNSTASHLWYEEEITLYNKTFLKQKYFKNESYNTIDTSHLEQIAISGGEPFLSKDCEKFLEKLRSLNRLKTIKLSFATNCTVIPSDSFHQSLLDCDSLTIVLSIDGYEKLNDYFRSPSKWEECVEVMKYFNNLINLRKDKLTHISFRASVYIYNVNKLIEIEEFFKENFPKFTISKRNLSESPPCMSIKNMPKGLKDLVRPIVESYGESYKDVLNFLNQEGEDLFDTFVSFHSQLDEIRNESLEDCNEILNSYIKNYKNLNKSYKVITLEEMIGNCTLSETISNG